MSKIQCMSLSRYIMYSNFPNINHTRYICIYVMYSSLQNVNCTQYILQICNVQQPSNHELYSVHTVDM